MTAVSVYETVSLDKLLLGDLGTIVTIEMTGSMKRRLLDLGFVPGTNIEVAFISPLGDPRAYRVRDTVLALRTNEALSIMVRR